MKPQCLIWTRCAVIEVETERWLSNLSSWYGNLPLPWFSADIWRRQDLGVMLRFRRSCTVHRFFFGHFGESLNMDVPVNGEKEKWSDGRAVKMLYRKVSVGGNRNSAECNWSHVRLSLSCCTLNCCNCAVETASNCNKGNFYTFLHKPAQMSVPVSCRAQLIDTNNQNKVHYD